MLLWRTQAILAYALLGVMIFTNFYSQMRTAVYTFNGSEHRERDDLKTRLVTRYSNRMSAGMSPSRDDIEKSLDFFNARTCTCSGKRTYGPLDDVALSRRKIQFEEWRSSRKLKHDPVVICPSMSPLTFVGGGLTVEPLHSIKLLGLTMDELFWDLSFQNGYFDITFTATKSFGVMEISRVQFPHIELKGNGTDRLSVQVWPGTSLATVNTLLESISYRSTKYDIELRDVVEVIMQGTRVEVNIHIRREPFPRLYDITVDDHISKKLTILTKTFQRQKPINRLIESVRKFYHNITVIIADDSDEPMVIDDPYSKYYKMPFTEGWFAGRNLALSQVRTKYFLWVDDDYEFTEYTVLEKLLERLEEPNFKLDLVSGILDVFDFTNVNNTVNTWHKVYSREACDLGYTVEEMSGHYQKIDGLPECVTVDCVLNFFMAKTDVVRGIGFDPTLERVGHVEFFWDGLGLLRTALCNDVKALHRPEAGKNYYNYRYTEDLGITKYEDRIMYSAFRHSLNCIKGMYKPPIQTAKLKSQS